MGHSSWEQPVTTATLLGWDQGKGGSSQASSAPSSACGCLWGAGQAAWPLPERPGTKTLAEGVEKHQSIRGEVESPDSWGGSAVSVSPGQVATLPEPRVCQPGLSPASSNPTCMAIGAGAAMAGSNTLPCLPHRVLWAKPEQGNSL